MKNILIITDTFPPQVDVGGLRPAMFSKYLPLFGWQPYILTRIYLKDDPHYDPSLNIKGLPKKKYQIEITWGDKDENKILKNWTLKDKMISFFKPDYSQSKGLMDKMLMKAEDFLSKYRIDVIYATSPSLHYLTIASILSKKFNIPWIADFRDIMEQDKFDDFREKILFYRLKVRRKHIVKNASSIITVSNYHSKILEQNLNKKVEVIYNGYDDELFTKSDIKKFKKFNITYMGRILNEWLRNPKPLFEALDILLKNKLINEEDVEISFYGTEPEIINKLSSSFYCKRILKINPRIKYSDVPSILKQSCINLVLTNKGRRGILTTKMFEYLAVKRPILSTPDDEDELSNIIKETKAGKVCDDVNEIKNTLYSWYKEWKKTGTVRCESDYDKILNFSRKNQTKKLSNILNNVAHI